MRADAAQDQERGGAKRTVREFVTMFRGLAGTAKQKAILDAYRPAPQDTHHLDCGGSQGVAASFDDAMRKQSLEVKPEPSRLYRGEALSAAMPRGRVLHAVSFKYARGSDLIDGVPSLVEVAVLHKRESSIGARNFDSRG